MEIHEFEWRNFSSLEVFFGILGLSKLRHKERIQKQSSNLPKKPKIEILQLEVKSVVMED